MTARKLSKKSMALGIAILALALVLCVVFLTRVGGASTQVPTHYLSGSFAFDVNDINLLAADVDYVFVGQVVSDDGTDYRRNASIDTDGDFSAGSMPYSKYTVRIMENMKGELIQEKDIPISKYGGLLEDKSAFYAFEGDVFPAVDGMYIFYAYGQEDGSLLLSGPGSVREVSGAKTSLNLKVFDTDDKIYSDTLTAISENTFVRERTRYVSDYDASK
ncbi:MAG: hypothetical protein LBR85_04515 [Oscillospiraceae bacterium]|jgi:hypothetical protein|nr:hypothetical protein [Oscillospiraceae bacterium]